MDDHRAQVIPLPTARSGNRDANKLEDRLDALPVRSQRLAPICQHRRATVDGDARKVICRDCGADLDPIQVLAQLARRDEADVHVQRRREKA